MSTEAALRQLSAFSHLSIEQFEQMAKAADLFSAVEGQIVLRHGDDTSKLDGLIRGALTIQRETPHGIFVLARLKPGDMFGEANFVDHHHRSTDVVAAAASEMVALDPDRLEEICRRDPRFEVALYWAIWQSASRKLRITTRMLSHFFSGSGMASTETSVGIPKPTGEPYDIEINAKRDLFLDQDLSHMEANFLSTLSREEGFDEGDTIFREGDEGDKLYFVLDGSVRISRKIPGSGEEALAILERGELFGEMALVDGRPRTADAVAHADVKLLSIEASVLERLLDIDKMSSARLLKLLCGTVSRRLRALDEKIVGWYTLSGGQSTTDLFGSQ